MQCHLGIDDTDSRAGGCTTYIASLIIEKLGKLGAQFTDYPNLIRLNPNIPYKTRGNAAIALRFKVPAPEKAFAAAKWILRNSLLPTDSLNQKPEPGLVLFIGDRIPSMLRIFSREALQTVLSISRARDLIKLFHLRSFSTNGGRGLIGAVAAIGNPLNEDHTFELICYRHPKNWGFLRKISKASVFKMDSAFRSSTFNNSDPESSRILIAPRGPDPVLLGIRGETPSSLMNAIRMLHLDEQVQRYVIYRSNQGTSEHLQALKGLQPHEAGSVRGTVMDHPRIERGGHVFFELSTKLGLLKCAAYEPSDSLRQKVSLLERGDRVQVGGGIRPASSTDALVLNLEFLLVEECIPVYRTFNPPCLVCGGGMTSMGYRQGLRCRKCRARVPPTPKLRVTQPRSITPGFYLPPPRSQRHLTKPIKRFGRERRRPYRRLLETWYGNVTNL